MKKNLSLAVFLCFGLLALISSCTKDTFTEKNAYTEQQKLELLRDSLEKSQKLLSDSLMQGQELLRDSLKNVGGVINYSVAVVLAGDATWLSNQGSKGAQGLNQVTVTIGQYGQTISATTDASGIASFKDLRIGTVNVNVSKTGFTEVDFVAVLPPCPDTVILKAYSIVRNVGTMVPVFSLTDNLSTISGIATVETDLTNDAPEVAANVDIMATINADCSAFTSRYFIYPDQYGSCTDCKWTSFDYYGIIKQIAFHSVISKATTAADGSFSIKVPSTPDGLPIKVFVSEFAATQKILQPTYNNVFVWGVQSVRTLFGPPITFNYSSIPTIGTDPDQVQSAFMQFSAPSGTPAAQPTSIASATAILSSSGIISVNITSPGSGYTQAPRVVFSHGSGWNSVNAEGTAVLTNGSVSAVTISPTNPGTGYLPGDAPTVTFSESVDIAASATPVFSYSLVGFSGLGVNDKYTSTAPTVSIVGDGTGATAHAIMAGNITKANITNPGAGYTSVPKVVISDGKGNTDLSAAADMTDYAPLFSITYVKPTSGYPLYDGPPAAAPTVVISSASGSGATGNCTLSGTGDLVTVAGVITTTTPGTGYTTATVTIAGGGGWALGKANIPVPGGGVTGITITDGGFGYTSAPTITITGDGAGATLIPAIVRFPISSITLNNAGSGYDVTLKPSLTVGGTAIAAADISVKYLRMLEAITYTVGTTYEATPVATITSIDGAGSGATATFDVSWKVGALAVDNQGSGYTYIPNVIIGIPQTGGTTATATATLGNGVLKDVIVDQPGKGYTAAPNVEIYEGTAPANVSKEAQLTATVANGLVTGITVTNGGSGYAYPSSTYTVKISTFKTPGAATAHPNPKSGQIDYIQINDPGSGYAVIPTVEIVNNPSAGDVNGFGKGATATAVVTDGRVSSITVTNPGSGYYAVPTITITIPSALVKAVGQCYVDDIGRITGVSFPVYANSTGTYGPYTQGYGYTSPPTVTFFPSVPGKGTGATGVAIISNGRVTGVVMTNQGSGYLGRNNPTSTMNLTFTPSLNIPIVAFAGKTYIRDLNFGTGKRISVEDTWYWDKK